MPNFAFMKTGDTEGLVLQCADGSVVVAWSNGDCETYDNVENLPIEYARPIQDNSVIVTEATLAILLMVEGCSPTTDAVALYDHASTEPFAMTTTEDLVTAANEANAGVKTLANWVFELTGCWSNKQ
jgi:hypothetical protein